ncbi:MAG: nicotinamide-nucleotide amidohydrolase family protein [Chloroflexota bacterium]|nr:nicotinamide-nucleotide amidohydrolase family protein [Chloroflexota bacterium]
MKPLEEIVGALLRERKLTLATAESATGGLIASLIVNVPGCSRYFRGGVVAPSDETKQRVLRVKKATLKRYGAASPQAAAEMAEGARRLLGADLGLSETGSLGTITEPEPAYIGLASPQGISARQVLLTGHGHERHKRAAQEALRMLQEYLHQNPGALSPRCPEPVEGSKGDALEERPVVTCFLEHEERIALLRRSARVGTYQGRWAGVSGYIEPGHTAYEQAMEELREEAGLGPEDLRLAKEGSTLEAIDAGLGRKWVIHPFRFQLLSPEKLTLDWEHTELQWVEPEEIASYETVPRLAEAWERVA